MILFLFIIINKDLKNDKSHKSTNLLEELLVWVMDIKMPLQAVSLEGTKQKEMKHSCRKNQKPGWGGLHFRCGTVGNGESSSSLQHFPLNFTI